MPAAAITIDVKLLISTSGTLPPSRHLRAPCFQLGK